MTRASSIILLVSSIFILCLSPGTAVATEQMIPPGATCSACGMTVDPASRFSAWATGAQGKRLFFCDVGDMLSYLKDGKEANMLNVRDYETGEWIDGNAAFYVKMKGLKTPMSWGIAAFRNERDATKNGTPLRLPEAYRLVK